ncbi:hypothetical protein FOZ61_006218 [Perkinsus olseni]|uniref:Uncharacterized protein n=1 Tax=Perkinsus olseni TaxID=32597 RepID=A0A7J6LEA0_PEROL|nr:hypothetical protein FOZ61_006218 [Perkinsus olseni]
MLFVVGVRSTPHDNEAEVLSGVIALLSWVLQFTLPLVFVGIYFKLTNGRAAPIRRAAVEKVEVVEGGEKAGSDGNSFDMAPRMSDDDECGHDGKSSDYDGDSEGSVGDDEESASEETDGKMGKSCEKLFAESFVIDENELESTDDLLRRINEDNDDSCRVDDDDDGRSEISSPEASPIVHNTFGEDNIWKPKPGSSSCSSPANLPAATLPNSWDAFDAAPAGNDGSYLGTSLDEVLEFNEKCEAEASGEGHQELYNGLEDHRRDENDPDVGQARSTEAKNAAARQALELAIERYPREAAFVCHQLLQNLTSERILIQPETYDLMIRAAEVAGHQGLASLLYSNAGRANQQPSSVRVPYPPPADRQYVMPDALSLGSNQLRLYPVVTPSVPGRGDHLAPMTRSLDALSQHQRTVQFAAAAAAATAYRQQQQYLLFTQLAAASRATAPTDNAHHPIHTPQAPSAMAALEIMYQRQQQQQQQLMSAHQARLTQQQKEGHMTRSTHSLGVPMVPKNGAASR